MPAGIQVCLQNPCGNKCTVQCFSLSLLGQPGQNLHHNYEKGCVSLCRCSNDVLAFFHLERNKLFSSITVNTGTACKGFLFNILLNVVTMSPKNTLEDDIFMQLTSYKFSLWQLCKCVIFPRAFNFKQMCKIIKRSMDLFKTT